MTHTTQRLTVMMIGLGICLAAACGALANESAKSPLTVRLGYFPNVTHAAAVVGVARGAIASALAPTATLEVKTFNAGSSLIEALFAREIDIGYIGSNPAINGYVKSKGEALRIIAGAASGGALLIVRPDANIKRPEDLNGKKLATPQLGNTQDVALRHYLLARSLNTIDHGGTVQIIPTQNADILTLFRQGSIDGAWAPEPWASRLILEGNGDVFLDERDLWPGGRFVTAHVIVSAKFLAEHPDAVKAFLRAHVETVQFIGDNLDKAKTIVNDEIEHITTRRLAEATLDKSFETLEITYDPVQSSLFTAAEHAFALGFLGNEQPDLSGIYDLTLLDEVLAEKGLAVVSGK
ncbi:MAG: ABC transporter substrate-binding protein [Candidatus Roseilinea sp.]|uniref:ABC transporter substrate-binding protein n=1 Tax=Candidatus Roseilinea sp. TaxID=2838777 RepID=UPI00404B8911